MTYAVQCPSSKFVPKSIIGTIPNTNKNLRYPAPVFKTYPQSIIGTVPNTNNNLCCSSAHPQTLSPKSIVGTIPNTNNNLRYLAPILKIYIQKYCWYYSKYQ